MSRFQERHSILVNVLKIAASILRRDPTHPANQVAREHVEFCIRHGYFGEPTTSPHKWLMHGFLSPSRVGTPTPDEKDKYVGVIPCFSDEVRPCPPKPPRTNKEIVVSEEGYINIPKHIFVMGNIEKYTFTELAFLLFHEVRHIRQWFGGIFESLPPLEGNADHESQTWKHQFDLLDLYGEQVWQRALEQELAYVVAQYQQAGRRPGQAYFAYSGQLHPELDTLFGPLKSDLARGQRSVWLGIRACFLLVERSPVVNRVQAYTNIVTSYYDWAQKQH